MKVRPTRPALDMTRLEFLTRTVRGKVSLLMVLLALAACATSSEMGPPAVVEAFYKAASEGNYEEVKQYYSRAPLLIEGILLGPRVWRPKDIYVEAPPGDPKGILDHYTRAGTLVRIEIQHVKILGDWAACRVRKHLKDGSTQPAIVELVRDRADGKWKISWSTSTL